MRRTGAVLTMTCVMALGTAGGSAGSHRDRDEVSGAARNTWGGPVESGWNKLVVDAHSDPSGGNPGGVARGSGDVDGAGPIEPFAVSGKVTCLRVAGNRATIKFRFDKAEGSIADHKGGGVQIIVQDNGKPRDGDAVDANGSDLPQRKEVFEATQSQCDDPALRPDYDPVDSGDYVVRDR